MRQQLSSFFREAAWPSGSWNDVRFSLIYTAMEAEREAHFLSSFHGANIEPTYPVLSLQIAKALGWGE